MCNDIERSEITNKDIEGAAEDNSNDTEASAKVMCNDIERSEITVLIDIEGAVEDNSIN